MQVKNESFFNFSKNLARLLKERGCKKKDFAQKMKVSPTVISHWLRGEENGGYCPRKKTLPLIAEFFGVSVEELLGEVEVQDLAYWKSLCEQQREEIENLKLKLSKKENTERQSDKLKEAMKLIVDSVADLIEERNRLM